MANPRFLYSNLVDSATITAITESVTLPASNVAHNLRSRVYRTGTTVATERLVFDMGSAKSVTCVVLLDHTLTSGDSGIKLMGNSSDSWGTPSFTQSLTWNSGPIVAFFSSQSYQYWAVEFTKSASSETRDIGRIFIGTYYESARDVPYNGQSIKQIDLSKTGRSKGGQTYSDVGSIYDQITLKFEMIANAQYDQFRIIADAVGTHTPFFVSLNHDTEPQNWLYYVKFRSLQNFTGAILGGVAYWNTSMTLDEQL